MTDEPGSSTGATRSRKLKIMLGIIPDPSGSPSFIWLERWNARIIWFFIVIGVPLLGMSGFEHLIKWIIAAAWFAFWTPFFMYFEVRELIGQMLGRGSIRSDQLSEQQDTAQLPRYGLQWAVYIWALVYAIHVTVAVFPFFATSPVQVFLGKLAVQIYYSWWDSWITYHWVEWFIIFHAWLVTKRFNKQTYDVGNILSKATPMGERVERRVPSGG